MIFYKSRIYKNLYTRRFSYLLFNINFNHFRTHVTYFAIITCVPKWMKLIFYYFICFSPYFYYNILIIGNLLFYVKWRDPHECLENLTMNETTGHAVFIYSVLLKDVGGDEKQLYTYIPVHFGESLVMTSTHYFTYIQYTKKHFYHRDTHKMLFVLHWINIKVHYLVFIILKHID